MLTDWRGSQAFEQNERQGMGLAIRGYRPYCHISLLYCSLVILVESYWSSETDCCSRWNQQDLDVLEQEFRSFKSALHNEPILSTKVSKATPMDGFNQSWASLQVRFPKLIEFCGGLATVFPGTSTVESDFSVLNWEFNEFRKSLTDFSLEGIMQSKQFWMLNEIHSSLGLNS
jgi:hypothetical protein